MAKFVCIEGKSSRTYIIQQKTRQGGILSPWLFLVFIDDLIEDLQSLHVRVSLHTVHLGSPMFAGDLAMLLRTKSGLDKLLQTSWEYSEGWQFTFNITKTVILTLGEKEEVHILNCGDGNWKFGSSDLSEKDTLSNLGKSGI